MHVPWPPLASSGTASKTLFIKERLSAWNESVTGIGKGIRLPSPVAGQWPFRTPVATACLELAEASGLRHKPCKETSMSDHSLLPSIKAGR